MESASLKKLNKWLAVAILLRITVSMTNLRDFHPDYWLQTGEFAHLLVHGLATPVHEFFGHLRNLTLPTILTIPAFIGHWLNSPLLAIFLTKSFTALLDFSILWGLLQTANHFNLLKHQKALKLALLTYCFCWFLVKDSVTVSIEHFSAIAFWIGLGLYYKTTATKRLIFVGICMALTGVFRYPSGLLGVGTILAMLYATRHDEKPLKSSAYLIAGSLIGLTLGAFGDLLVFGRPYESLYMYLQYNVFTDLSSQYFGSESILVYPKYFLSLFPNVMLPIGTTLLILGTAGLLIECKRGQPWAIGALVYLLGHFYPAHKEGRFLSPIILIIIFSAIKLCIDHKNTLTKAHSIKWLRVSIKTLVIITIVANFVNLLETLRGELLRPRLAHFTATASINDKTCAFVSSNSIYQSWIPKNQPNISYAEFKLNSRQRISELMNELPLIWVTHPHKCNKEQNTLLVTPKSEPIWSQLYDCQYLSGWHNLFLSETTIEELQKYKIDSAGVYRCPSKVLEMFSRPAGYKLPFTTIKKFDTLPPYGISGKTLETFITKQNR